MMRWPPAPLSASAADPAAGGTALRSPPAPATQPRPSPIETVAPRRPAVVIQTSFLGDVILTTPLLAALAERGPVDVVTTPAAAPILARDPSVRAIITYDKRGAARGVARPLAHRTDSQVPLRAGQRVILVSAGPFIRR